MSKSRLLIGACLGLLAFGASAMAEEPPALGAGLADIAATPEDDAFALVATREVSLTNVAPVLLTFLNNGPVFGLPGTVTGDILHRTQLAGDWGGLRTKLTRHGVFLDSYSTSAYQTVTSGGLETSSAYVQNNQLSLNIDTGRAGLWAGGLLHVTVQSRFGEKPDETFVAGTSAPHYTGLVLPDPLAHNKVEASEYFITQALGKKIGVVVGKISDIYIPDQTAFGNSYKTGFANFNFNKNPMTINFYNPTAWAVLGAWKPNASMSIAAGVLDPDSKSDNFAKHAFDHVNLYLMGIFSYQVAGLPGQFSPAYNWSNKPKVDLAAPFGALAPSQIPQAVGSLLGVAENTGLPVNTKDESWFAIANVSQYLYLKEAPGGVGRKLRTGQPLRGLGVFARVGYAPEATNPVTRDASVALFGQGLMDARPNDSFGAGFYYDQMSAKLKADVARLTRGAAGINDEKGAEVFYQLALTPAVRLVASYQHIWDPVTAAAARGVDHADVVITRLAIAW